jgi:hypothetical protein
VVELLSLDLLPIMPVLLPIVPDLALCLLQLAHHHNILQDHSLLPDQPNIDDCSLSPNLLIPDVALQTCIDVVLQMLSQVVLLILLPEAAPLLNFTGNSMGNGTVLGLLAGLGEGQVSSNSMGRGRGGGGGGRRRERDLTSDG